MPLPNVVSPITVTTPWSLHGAGDDFRGARAKLVDENDDWHGDIGETAAGRG